MAAPARGCRHVPAAARLVNGSRLAVPSLGEWHKSSCGPAVSGVGGMQGAAQAPSTWTINPTNPQLSTCAGPGGRTAAIAADRDAVCCVGVFSCVPGGREAASEAVACVMVLRGLLLRLPLLTHATPPHIQTPQHTTNAGSQRATTAASRLQAAPRAEQQQAAKAADTTSSDGSAAARQMLGMKGAADGETDIWKIRVQLTKPVTWVPLIWGERGGGG